MPVNEQDRARLGLPSVAGAHVMDRTPGSPAERANIPVDAVITALNGTPVGTPTDLSMLLARAGAGSEVELTYYYSGKPASTKVVLGFTGGSRDIGRANPNGAPPANPSAGAGPSTWSAPVPALPGNATARGSDTQRIDALERRIQQLEQKVNDLENRQQHGT